MSGLTQTKTIQHGACTIVLLRPELTEAERSAREQHARNTLERVMREYYIQQGKEARS